MAKLTRTTLPPPVPRRRPLGKGEGTPAPADAPKTAAPSEKPSARKLLEPNQPPEHDVLEHGEVPHQEGEPHSPNLQPSSRPLDARALERMKSIPMLDAKQVAEPRSDKSETALYALDHAQEPGVFFQEEPNDPDRPEEEEDPELAAAVEEAISLLFGVRGIHHIGPGRNEADEKVVVIAAGRGFGEKSMEAIPPTIREFKTLLAVPYDMLPLRKER